MDELEQPADQLDSDAAANAAEEHDQAAEHDDDQVDEASQEQAEEDEEIEVGGKKFALPKSAAETLKAERLMQSDYTRKTQEVAESRKAVEAEREQVKQAAAQQQQYIKEIAKVTALDDQLEQYKQLDWNALSDQDPVAAQKLHFQFQALQQQRQQAEQAVTQKQHEHALAEQQNLAKQVQEADAYFKREIPGWSGERSARLQQYAVEIGIPGSDLAMLAVKHPAIAKALHKAELFDQLEKKQSTKPKAPTAPPAPVTRVSAARASAKVDPAKLSVDDWMAQRNKQVRGQR